MSVEAVVATVPWPAARAGVAPLAAASGTFPQPVAMDLVIYRGDSGRFRVTVVDDQGNPMDVSGATWDCDLRVTAEDVTPLASLTCIPVVGQPSSVDVVLFPTVSAGLIVNGVWDLQMTLSPTEVHTLLAGKFTVTPDVSRPPP